MTGEKYVIPENPQYSEEIRKLQDDDPVSASKIVNPLIQKIIENIAAVKRMMGENGDGFDKALEESLARIVSLEKTVNGHSKVIGYEDPTSKIEAQVGQIYINVITGAEWKCIAVGENGTSWDRQSGLNTSLTADDVGAIPATVKGTAGGVASLDVSGKVPESQLPSLTPYVAGTKAPSDTKKLWIDTTANTGGLKYHDGSAWVNVPVAYT